MRTVEYENRLVCLEKESNVMLTAVLFLLSILNALISSQNENAETMRISKNCRERNRPINSIKGDLYAIIDAIIGEKLTLMCHYCSENDDGRPKIWYKNKKFGRSNQNDEVELGMENNSTKNRIYVTDEHSLVIDNFNESDTGLYYCKRTESQEGDEKYNYLVELIYDLNVTSVETGNSTAWKQYYDDYFAPINKMFDGSLGTEFAYLRNILKIKLELVTQWDPYGVCEVCGRPQGQGLKKKKGYCRIKLTQQMEVNITGMNDDQVFIATANAISCRSIILSRIYPGISNLTKIIPYFIQHEKCEGVCNPDAEGVNAGWKLGKAKGFKYRKTIVLQEYDHLTVVCPESTLENEVTWKRNGKALKRGRAVIPEEPEEEPRIIVDAFNTLYLVNVKVAEEGNYTCQVDSIMMQQLRVYIVSKSRFLSDALLRHFMYLGFILVLTTTCYVGGLIITCYKRDTFKDYEELKEIHAKEDESDFNV